MHASYIFIVTIAGATPTLSVGLPVERLFAEIGVG